MIINQLSEIQNRLDQLNDLIDQQSQEITKLKTRLDNMQKQNNILSNRLSKMNRNQREYDESMY